MKSLLATTLFGLLMQVDFSFGYKSPVRANAPDPSLVYADGQYHLTYTSGNHIEITRAPIFGELQKGETKVVWEDDNSSRNKDIWAPEVHHIDNVWYIFYSSRDANVDNSYRTRVIKGCNGPNPYDCKYEFGADLVPPKGKQGGKEGNDGYSVDGSFLEIPGKGRYHLMSTHNKDSIQSIGITNLDTKNWSVDEWHVISTPDHEWEKHMGGGIIAQGLNEGPHPLYHGDDIWISFSGSTCNTPFYALGLLHYNGGDPLQKSSWEKTGPHLTSANGNYGTGHNSFFKSPDGKEIWNLYHATSQKEGGCGPERYTMAGLVTFDKDSNPKFEEPQAHDKWINPPSGQ